MSGPPMKKLHAVPKAGLRVVERYAESRIPTAHGTLTAIVFREARSDGEPHEHVALVAGGPEALGSGEPVLARVHSECWTGEVIGSLKCDCRAQLEHALGLIAESGRGVVVYLRQEGRGIGLGNKIRAYALQERGHDTVDSNRLLGFGDDLRTYEAGACILKQLGAYDVELITNNPEKVGALEREGLRVTRRVPSLPATAAHSAGYLETKRVRMGHLLPK